MGQAPRLPWLLRRRGPCMVWLQTATRIWLTKYIPPCRKSPKAAGIPCSSPCSSTCMSQRRTESAMSRIMRLQSARVGLPCACRSQSISQSVQASLAEIRQGKQQQSATPVEVFLEELHSAVDSLQSSKARASDVVSKLEQLPGRLQSSAVDCSAVRREAEWLAYLTLSTLLPGALGSYEQVQQCHILMQRLLSLTRRQHA